MSLYIGNKKYAVIQQSTVSNQDILITANGNYTADLAYTGFGVVRVNVPESVLEAVTVTPTTSAQLLTPLNDGFSSVSVNAVTSSIDSNILASNIKSGVTILGVTGTLSFITENLNITPTTTVQSYTSTLDGYDTVTVSAVTADIDSNIISGSIKSGISILGVTGTVIEANNTTRNIYENGTFTPATGYTGFSEVVVDVQPILETLEITATTYDQIHTSNNYGFSTVTVNAVTASVDSNIIASNIKSGVEILNVTGTVIELSGEELIVTSNGIYEPSTGNNGLTKVTVDVNPDLEDITINPATTSQTLVSDDYGYGTITVNPVTATIDSDIIATNIKSGVEILGVTGTVTESVTQELAVSVNGTYSPETGYTGFSEVVVDIDTVNNEDLTVTANGTYTPGTGYTGFSEVVVNVDTVNNQTLTVTDSGTYSPETGYTGFSEVVVDLSWIETALTDLNAGDSLTTIDELIDGSLEHVETEALNIRAYAFYYQENLEEIVLTDATTIGDYAFANSGITTLTLLGSSVCSLGTDVFLNTSIEDGTGVIYIPNSLQADYLADEDWNSYSNLFQTLTS